MAAPRQTRPFVTPRRETAANPSVSMLRFRSRLAERYVTHRAAIQALGMQLIAPGPYRG